MGNGEISGRRWRQFAHRLAEFFLGFEIADNEFAVAFLGKKGVGEIAAVVGELLVLDVFPGVVVAGIEGPLFSEEGKNQGKAEGQLSEHSAF